MVNLKRLFIFQSLSLDYVEIDCRDVFAPGQLAVAMARAKTTAGLAVHQLFIVIL